MEVIANRLGMSENRLFVLMVLLLTLLGVGMGTLFASASFGQSSGDVSPFSVAALPGVAATSAPTATLGATATSMQRSASMPTAAATSAPGRAGVLEGASSMPGAVAASATPTPSATAAATASVTATSTPTEIAALQTIDFDYQDSLTQHGWTMVQNEARETALSIEHVADRFVNGAISISSPVAYGMDFEVEQATSDLGRVVEFVAQLGEGAALYAFVGLARDDGSHATGWLKFENGAGQPTAVSTDIRSGESEWRLFIEPVSSNGEWMLYRIDFEDVIAQTFGNDAWRLQRLIKFRIRGNLSLDYISVFETD